MGCCPIVYGADSCSYIVQVLLSHLFEFFEPFLPIDSLPLMRALHTVAHAHEYLEADARLEPGIWGADWLSASFEVLQT